MHILIAGPDNARPFLEKLAAAIPKGGADVACRYDLDRPSDYDKWADTDILVAFARPCDRRDMDLAPRLRAIILPSLGFDGIDIDAATARGIAVANGHVIENFETVAEAAFLFMLMSLYDIHEAQARLRLGAIRTGPPAARMLKGKTIGIIGFGNIARALVGRLEGWGARTLVSSRGPIAHPGGGVIQCDLDTLLANSDIVLPLVPLTGETQGLFTKKRLLSMKRGAIFINLSRGAVVDEAALCDPEVIGHLGGIALDVFEVEPLPKDSPLRHHPKAILTGHEIAHTQENLTALFDMALKNILSAVAGDAMPTLLNPASGQVSG